ncbi:MAG: phage portal protein [Steroidobacteraceae bacterium]
MNVFERGIAAISPAWALSRSRARAALGVVRAVELGYDANQVGRRAAHWKAGGGSANSETIPALTRVRNRSRDMVRNNPYARSAIQKLVARSIGTGIVARPPASVRNVWKEFVEVADFEEQLDLYGLQSLAGRTVFESGECLLRRIRGTRASRPLQIQVLEPDYLDDMKFGAQANGNFVIGGIEISQDGRRQGYWLYDHHPGDTVQLSKTWQSRRVPAADILHVYEKDRPGQLRGMPRLTTSLMRLRDVDEYQDAVMMRKKIEACYTAFVTGGNPDATVVDGDRVTTDAANRRIETLSPGMIFYGSDGQEITFGSPGAISKDEYTTDQLHAIAAGIGVTYEQLTGDYSEVTYLSARAAQLELRELVEMFRWISFIPMACNGIWRWFLDAYYTAGRLRTDTYPAEWTAPAFPWIDPSKDVTAAKAEVSGGLTSLSAQIRARGEDPETVFREIADERKKLKELGVKLDTTSAAGGAGDDANGKGKGDGKAAAPDDDNDDDDDAN